MSNAASTTDAAPKRDWVTHAVLLLGVVIFALPIWIVLMGSTHDSATIGRGEVPLLPGPHALENYATAWSGTRDRIGAQSMMLAAGMVEAATIGTTTIKVEGASPCVHFSVEPLLTCIPAIFRSRELRDEAKPRANTIGIMRVSPPSAIRS